VNIKSLSKVAMGFGFCIAFYSLLENAAKVGLSYLFTRKFHFEFVDPGVVEAAEGERIV
jgi:hypothetical protein